MNAASEQGRRKVTRRDEDKDLEEEEAKEEHDRRKKQSGLKEVSQVTNTIAKLTLRSSQEIAQGF